MQSDLQEDLQRNDAAEAADMAQREIDDAAARLTEAASRVRHEARNAGSTLTSLVLDELDRRANDVGQQLRVLAGRMRGEDAPDGAGEQASKLIAEASGLIDDLSHRLEGQSARQIGQRLERFGRENPGMFLLGCLLTGALGGRIIAASSDNSTLAERARSAFAATGDAVRDTDAQNGDDGSMTGAQDWQRDGWPNTSGRDMATSGMTGDDGMNMNRSTEGNRPGDIFSGTDRDA